MLEGRDGEIEGDKERERDGGEEGSEKDKERLEADVWMSESGGEKRAARQVRVQVCL